MKMLNKSSFLFFAFLLVGLGGSGDGGYQLSLLNLVFSFRFCACSHAFHVSYDS